MAGEISIRATLARPALPVTATAQVAYILLEFQPSQVMAQVRMPVNVAFVLDRSGSMRGEKIDRVRRATSRALQMLDAQDVVSLVVFDHRTEVLIPATNATSPAAMQEVVNRIRDAGGTKIAPGVEKGLREITKGHPNAIRRLVLLTDGQTENEDECLYQADQAGKMSVPITALGVGRDWNEDLLIDMANRSGGTADYIDNPDTIITYFQNTVQRAQASSITNANLILRFVQGIVPRTVWQVVPLISNLGYQPVSDRDVALALGQLESDSKRALLLEVMVDPKAAGQYRIGQADLTYDVPVLGIQGEHARADMMLTFTADQREAQQVNPPVMNIVEKVSAFKLQTRALQDVQAGNIGAATQKLQSAVTRLLSQGEVELAQTMQKEITNLEQSGQMSSEGQKTMKFGARKTVRLSDLDLPEDMR